MGMAFKVFPLILIVVIVYNLVVFGGLALGGAAFVDSAGRPDMEALLSSPIFYVGLVSGPWEFTWGTLFVTVGLFALFVEILRSASSETVAIYNHALSLILLVICLLEFVVVKGFNTSTFFYLTLMAMIDVLAGFTVSIINARRDFGGGHVAL